MVSLLALLVSLIQWQLLCLPTLHFMPSMLYMHPFRLLLCFLSPVLVCHTLRLLCISAVQIMLSLLLVHLKLLNVLSLLSNASLLLLLSLLLVQVKLLSLLSLLSMLCRCTLNLLGVVM